MKTNYRAVFEKYDRAKYISHLDLYTCIQRTFKRAKVPIWYTEGFNPHAYIMFPLPLSLGYESHCEIMDFALTEELPFDEIIQRMNAALPVGMRIASVSYPVKKHTEIVSSDYSIKILCGADGAYIKARLEEFMAQDEIIAQKRTKSKKMTSIDLKPFAELSDIRAEGNVLEFKLRMPSGTEKNYNPSLLLDLFFGYAQTEPETVKITREKIICADGKEFL